LRVVLKKYPSPDARVEARPAAVVVYLLGMVSIWQSVSAKRGEERFRFWPRGCLRAALVFSGEKKI
jgi:hypothetical protein